MNTGDAEAGSGEAGPGDGGPRAVVVVSGPPGSGKTTIAARLAAESERGVHLETDWFHRSIRSGFIAPHESDADAQNTAVIDVFTDAAASFASSGYSVVVDGIVGPWFLDRVARRLAARGIALHYLVLRPGRDVALDRVRRRDGTTETAGAEVMFGQFADLGELEPHVIASDESPDVVLDRCRMALDTDGLRVSGDAWIDDRWPVSVKGVLGWDDRFVVLRNRRDEWELPGGRLDSTDATPVAALRREMREELGVEVEVGALIDSWIHDVEDNRVLILTYQCTAEQPGVLLHSDEHTAVGLLAFDDLGDEAIPLGYVRSITRSRRPG